MCDGGRSKMRFIDIGFGDFAFFDGRDDFRVGKRGQR